MARTTTKDTAYQLHRYCAELPEIHTEDFDELVEDIRRHGLNNPIVLYKEKILDGRTRYEACVKAGVEPIFIEFEEVCPAVNKAKSDSERNDIALNWVISQNVHRRHLNESQKAMMISKLTGLRVGQSKANARTSGNSAITQGEAATQASISRRLVISANKIRKECPRKIPSIESGKKTIGQVLKEIEGTKENKVFWETLGMDESDRPRPKESIACKPPFIDMVRSIDLNKNGTLTGKDFGGNVKTLAKLVAASAISRLVGMYVQTCHLLDVLTRVVALTTELDVTIPFLDLERSIKVFEADKRDTYKWIKDVHQFRNDTYPRWYKTLAKQAKTSQEKEKLTAVEKHLNKIQVADRDYVRDLAKLECKVPDAKVRTARMEMYMGNLAEFKDLGLDSVRVPNKKLQRATRKRPGSKKRKRSK